jgi:hypothetical protein
LAVALGVAGLLILWGVKLLLNPRPEVIEKEVIVEKPVSINPNIYISPGQGFERLQALNENARTQIEKFESKTKTAGDTAQSVKTVYDYVLFKHIPFDRDGLQNIIIGMRFPESRAEKPSRQWCYVVKPTDTGVQNRLTLSIVENGVRNDQPITRDMAQTMATDLNNLENARDLCVFE